VVVLVFQSYDASTDIDRFDLAADFSLPDPKGHANFCHHLPSVIIRRQHFKKSGNPPEDT